MSITQSEAPLDLVGTGPERHRGIVVALGDVPAEPAVRRIRAVDLQMATAAYNEARIDGSGDTVLLDVEIVLATTAREARIAFSKLALAPRGAQSNFLYIGTASGLAGLVADIGAARVADGVTLIPLDDPVTVRLLASDAIPLMERAGTIDERSAGSLTERLVEHGGS